MLARIAAATALICLASCKRAPDPLAEHRAACEKLQKAGELKKGLSIEQCASKLASAAVAVDPAKRADELLERLAALTAKGRGSSDQSHIVAVRDVVDAIARLGQAAAPAALAEMDAAGDSEFRIAVARALVDVCSDDSGKRD